MESHEEPLQDHLGRTMFLCTRCSGAISRSDVVHNGLRLPDQGETADEYLDAELLDGIEHSRCAAEAAAS